MMTPIEAHRAGLCELRYTDQFITEVLGEFEIPESLAEPLWNCLEGAADAYFSITFERAKHDFETAQRALAMWKKHLDGALTFVPILALFERHLSPGGAERFRSLGVGDETSFALAVHYLAGATETVRSPESTDDWRSTGQWETLAHLSIKLERMLAAIPEGAPRKDALRALKFWTLCLMRFWVCELGRKLPPLTKTSGATKGRHFHGTQNISDFSNFCERCAVHIGIRPNFRRAIELARPQLDREIAIDEALKRSDYDLARRLLSASKDTNS